MPLNKKQLLRVGQPLGTGILGILAIWAVVHAVRTRTLGDFVRYTSFIAIPVMAIAAIIAIISWVKSGYRKLSTEDVGIILFSPIFFAFIGAFYYAFGVSIKDAYLWFREPSEPKNISILLAAFATLGLGAALFIFRLRLRSVYGFTEALVGVIVAMNRASISFSNESTTDSTFYLIILTGGIYLVVRGFDNIHQGLTKPPLDPVGVTFLKWISTLGDHQSEASGPNRLD